MLVLLFAVLMAVSPYAQQLTSLSGTISGTISALPTDERLSGASVSAYEIITRPNSDSLEFKLAKTVITDARGEYRFESLAIGNYFLRARVPGFYDARIWEVCVQNRMNSTANLFMQVADIGDYVPGMEPEAGSIYGVVNSVLDRPIADVLVTAICADTMGPTLQTRTNEKGEFKLEVIRNGRYIVTYSKAHFGFGSIGVQIQGKKQVHLKLTQ